MCASHSVLNRLERRNESKLLSVTIPVASVAGRSNGPLVSPYDDGAESERIRWYPKDGELFEGRTKPEETLVEVRSDSDVQIDRQTFV
jgi:hypothetical protein